MALAAVTDRYPAERIKTYYDAGYWRSQTMFDVLEQRVADRGDKVFLTDSTTSYTFRELRDSALRLAAGLASRGVGPGDRVAVQLPNWTEFVVAALAISRIGAIIVPIMPIYRRDDVSFVVETAGVTAAFAPAGFRGFDHAAMFADIAASSATLRTLIVVRGDAPAPPPEFPTASPAASPAGDDGSPGPCAASRVISYADLAAGPGPDPDPRATAAAIGPGPGADDPFMIVFSSGTTSRPKGCLHTFNTMAAGARLMIEAVNYTDADVQFGPSPITHTTGIVTSVLMPLLAGAASHLMEVWEPREGLERIAKYRCTGAVTATTFLQMLLNVYDPDVHDAASMRFWISAGAPIPGGFVEAAQAAFPDMGVLSLYGRTENLVTTMCALSDDPARSVTSDGKALPGQEVAILDEAGGEVPRGTEGDIAYRGSSNCLEYIHQPAETAAMFTPDGFSRSGDLGTMDADGYVRVTGRLKDIVIRGGLNISVRQVEDLLTAHPAVGAVAVVGMPDPVLGERLCCYLVPAAGASPLTLERMKEYLTGAGLAIQKVPERVEVVTELPMTATGKIRKHLLRAEITRKLSAS